MTAPQKSDRQPRSIMPSWCLTLQSIVTHAIKWNVDKYFRRLLHFGMWILHQCSGVQDLARKTCEWKVFKGHDIAPYQFSTRAPMDVCTWTHYRYLQAHVTLSRTKAKPSNVESSVVSDLQLALSSYTYKEISCHLFLAALFMYSNVVYAIAPCTSNDKVWPSSYSITGHWITTRMYSWPLLYSGATMISCFLDLTRTLCNSSGGCPSSNFLTACLTLFTRWQICNVVPYSVWQNILSINRKWCTILIIWK